jgi:hypothetical protein
VYGSLLRYCRLSLTVFYGPSGKFPVPRPSFSAVRSGPRSGSCYFRCPLMRALTAECMSWTPATVGCRYFHENIGYLTQWGQQGTGDGEFDFGTGREAVDFVGSIAVDDDGFIYVADVGNRRIQKFAP